MIRMVMASERKINIMLGGERPDMMKKHASLSLTIALLLSLVMCGPKLYALTEDQAEPAKKFQALDDSKKSEIINKIGGAKDVQPGALETPAEPAQTATEKVKSPAMRTMQNSGLRKSRYLFSRSSPAIITIQIKNINICQQR